MKTVAVIGLPRCASTLICEGLAQHPQILSFGEVFSETPSSRRHFHKLGAGDDHWYDAKEGRVAEYIQLLSALAAYDGRTHLSFKLLEYHEPRAWDYLAKHPEIELIYCRRDNPLEALASVVAASLTGVWHARSETGLESARGRTFAIDPEKAEAWFIRNRELENRISRTYSKVHLVKYSDIARSYQGAMAALFCSLGVPSTLVECTQVKLATAPVAERVSNYRQLAEHFRETDWHAYFSI